MTAKNLQFLRSTFLAAVIAAAGVSAFANTDDAYLRGIEYFKNADYISAETELKKSNLPDAKILMAIIILNYTKSDESRESYAKQLISKAAKQGNSQALLETAWEAYEQKDYDAFEKNITQAAKNHKTAAVSYALYLGAQNNPTRISEAIWWLEKAIALGSPRASVVKANFDGIFRENYYFYKDQIDKITSTGFSEAYMLKFLFEKQINKKEEIMWLYLASDLEDNHSKNHYLKDYSPEKKTDAKQKALNWLIEKTQDKTNNISQSGHWCLGFSPEFYNKCLTYAVSDDFGCRSIQIKNLDSTNESYRETKSYQVCRKYTLNSH